jgi:threonylcarbamoyladenosine tRNA methylthiotransferase MtaB
MKYQLHTFGCKVNTYDSGLVTRGLDRVSGSVETQGSHVHVLNTCAVTGEATKEALRVIRKIKARDPLATVVVTGCGAQVDTEKFEALPSVDLVVANSHKGFLPSILEDYFKGKIKDRVFKGNIFRKDDLEPGGGFEPHHTRAFLKIQDGCNSFCTYCVIPFARGKSRSLGVQELVRRIEDLYDQGFREVVLTGVHIADYEDPVTRQGLDDLVETLLLKTRIQRFRLTSLEPGEVSERLLDLYQDSRLCPHFHMSIQSATDPVLLDMKRRYTQAQVQSSLQRIHERVPGVFIGMDVIVGFPTETAELFEETYKVLAELPWSKLHVFPYSERPGTKAALWSHSVPLSERKQRSQKLRELSLHRYQQELLQQVGTRKKVLLLTKGQPLQDSSVEGLSRDYWNVHLRPNLVSDSLTELNVLVSSLSDTGQLQAEVIQ